MRPQKLSRRKFFSLVGSAAVAAALPKPLVAVLGPAVSPAAAACHCSQCQEARRIIAVLKAERETGLLYGLPYWQVSTKLAYLGIDRSAK